MDGQFVDVVQGLNYLMAKQGIVTGVVVAGMIMVDVEEGEDPSIPVTLAMNVEKQVIMPEIVEVEEEVVVDAVGPLHLIGHVGGPHHTAGQDQGAGLVQGELGEGHQSMVTLDLVPGLHPEAGIVLPHEIENQEIALLHHAEIAHDLLLPGETGLGPQLQKIGQDLGQIQDKNRVHTMNQRQEEISMMG